MPEAVKDDKGKTDWSLLPVNAIEEVMKVFTHGTTSDPGREKNQWRFGTWWSRYWNASMRHTIAWWRGAEKDEKSGLHPLAHSICDQLMLLEMVMSGKLNDFDDRENWVRIKPLGIKYVGIDLVRSEKIQQIHLFEGWEPRPYLCINCGHGRDHTVHAIGEIK